MSKRDSISKRVRFEVFKRDSFTCQYCGRRAPDVVLQVDHVMPCAKGGKNDILNLVTSCFDCNSGKSDKLLSDASVVTIRRKQTEELQQRREQLEMMYQWHRSLLELGNDSLRLASQLWSQLCCGYHLSDYGKAETRKLIEKFGTNEVMEAMRVSTDHYLDFNEDGRPTHQSVDEAWKKIGGICVNKRRQKEDPLLKSIYYIWGILRNRLAYVDKRVAFDLIREALELGLSHYDLRLHASEVRNWTQWRSEIEAMIEEGTEVDDVD